jgi:DNA-directed RNA polymerase delta subunit
MAIVRIHCDGGIGNRFGAIIGGLRAAWAKGYDAEIYWAPNTNCGAYLEDLFSVIPAKMTTEPSDKSWPLVSHMKWEGREWYPADQWKKMNTSFEYTHDRWEGNGRDVMQKFVVHPDIQNYVDDFVQKHGIDKTWLGFHVRGTDKSWNPKTKERRFNLLNEVYSALKKHDKIFICSDDEEIEKEFADKVLINPKTHYVEKKVPGHWLMPSHTPGQHYVYNVNRTRESTIQAMQDMLILSKTTFRCPSSTFCFLAEAL